MVAFGKVSNKLRILTFLAVIALLKAINVTQPDTSADRIILKNSIAYHFVRNVKSIDAEVFITRRISISPLVEGITQLKEAQTKLEDFCHEIRGQFTGLKSPQGKVTTYSHQVGKRSFEEFLYFSEVGLVTFEEGRARCEYLKMQLPELYTEASRQRLSLLMATYNLTNTFAGITYDPIVALQRFIGTGLPWWQGIYNYSHSEGGDPDNISDVTDAPHIRFLYTTFERLITMYEIPSPGWSNQSYDADYRRINKEVALIVTPLICQEKTLADLPRTTFMTGSNPNSFSYNLRPYKWWEHPGLKNKPRAPRAKREARRKIIREHYTTSGPPRDLSFATMVPTVRIDTEKLNLLRSKRLVAEDTRAGLTQEICLSTAAYIGEIELRSRLRIVELLKLVDITIKVNEPTDLSRFKRSPQVLSDTTPSHSAEINSQQDHYRSERSPIGLFLLKNGVRSVWSLFGFLEKIRTNRRLNKLEKEVGRLQAASSAQAGMVDKISLIVANHSIIIAQLQVATTDLSKQITTLQKRVDKLDSRVDELNTIVHMSLAMTLLNGLTERTKEAMDHGFEMLEDIIRRAVMSETSARLLPVDQIVKVQTDLSVMSNSILDPEYKRMKSVIVSDPQNPELLLAIISAVALTRRNQELVKLIPVPWFKGNEVIKPILSHTAAILDQDAGTFTVLDREEAENCAKDGHCSTSNPERRNNAVACGIPQLFNWNLNKCDYESVLSDGTFLKRLGADGIVFSLKEAASSQLFCSGLVGTPRSLEGSGTLQIPAGCTLTITGRNGEATRIRSLPMSQIMQVQNLDLIVIGPEYLLRADNFGSPLNTSNPFTKIVSDHLQILGKQLEDTNEEVKHHSHAVIILASVLGFALLVIIGLSLLLYRYSSRFRIKVRKVKTDLEGVAGTLVAFERDAAERAKLKAENEPPRVPPRNLNTLLHQLEQMDKAVVPNDYLQFGESPLTDKACGASVYSNTREQPTHYSTAPRPKPRDRYLYPMAPLRAELYDMVKGENLKTDANREMASYTKRSENSSAFRKH